MRIAGQKIKLQLEHLLRMQIPQRFWHATFPGIPDEKLREVVANYLKDLNGNLDRGDGLLFWGDNSRGKTSAACVIAKEARSLGAPVLFTTAAGLAQAVFDKSEFMDGKSFIARAREVDLLVLDDLGKEPTGQSGFMERTFESLIRDRSSNRQATIITTNSDPGSLAERYKTSMMEVLRGCVLPVKVEGENLREAEGEQLRDRLSIE